jgi:hypothetical protein
MNRKIATLAAAVLSISVLMTACKKDDHDHDDHNHDEEELITKVKLKFYQQGAFIEDYVWDDPDGDGGNVPAIDTIKLSASTIYDSVQVEFSNANEDITVEVRQENLDHEVFYTKSKNLPLVIFTTDVDDKGQPLGLTSIWTTTGTKTSGDVRITLKHKPGIKGSSDEISKGETDIDVRFPIVIQ